MNKHRKKIILSEIEYWKKNNLLPEKYCDFLSTLYQGGAAIEEEEKDASKSVLHREKRNRFYIISSIIFFTVIVAISLFFLQGTIAIVIGGVGILLLISLTTIPFLKHSFFLPILYIATAFILLMISFKIWSVFFIDQALVLTGLLLVNCLLWIGAGRVLKLLYFTLSGALGILAIIGFYLYNM